MESSPPNQGYTSDSGAPAETEPAQDVEGVSITLTAYPSGKIRISEPFQPDTPEPLEGEGAPEVMGDAGDRLGGSTEDEGMPDASGRVFDSLDQAVKHMIQLLAEGQHGEAGTEEESMRAAFEPPPE